MVALLYSNYTENETEPVEEIEQTEYEYDYDAHTIGIYQQDRIYDLMNWYDYTSFTYDGVKKHYNYTAEDYSKISELDETYVYGFYMVGNRYTVDEVCKALGYEGIVDFLETNEFVDDEGNADINVFYEYNKKVINELMVKEGYPKD